MRETDRLRNDVRNTLDGDPWYGPSVFNILEGVDAAAASARPIDGGHTIWELVVHMTAWTTETVRRLKGAPADDPDEGDWQPGISGDAAAWQKALDDLRRAHDKLAGALKSLTDAELDASVGGNQVDCNGSPVTLHRTVVGLLQHDAYHAGQIVLLKKLIA